MYVNINNFSIYTIYSCYKLLVSEFWKIHTKGLQLPEYLRAFLLEQDSRDTSLPDYNCNKTFALTYQPTVVQIIKIPFTKYIMAYRSRNFFRVITCGSIIFPGFFVVTSTRMRPNVDFKYLSFHLLKQLEALLSPLLHTPEKDFGRQRVES